MVLYWIIRPRYCGVLQIGRGVTHLQLTYLASKRQAHYLPDVLCGCYSFYLAKEVSKGLELPETRVLLAWSKATIMKSGREGVDECMELLCKKLDKKGIPWAEVASTATVRATFCILSFLFYSFTSLFTLFVALYSLSRDYSFRREMLDFATLFLSLFLSLFFSLFLSLVIFPC